MNVLLDLDGTLTDPRQGIVGCLRHALIELAEAVPADEELQQLIGPPLRDAFRQFIGNDPERIEAAVKAYRTRFESVGMFENEVYPGIPEALDALRKRGCLFVATSKPRVFAARILDHFGLSSRFVEIYGSELDGTLSDKTELIAHVLADASLDPAHTIMVGDRHYDIAGAIGNDVRPVGVLWGYGSEAELRGAGAQELYAHPLDLARLVG